MRWGMIIDLRKCIGCGACSFICDQTNRVSFNRWRRVFDCGVTGNPERKRLIVPMSCMHCTQAPCQEVCPTAATYRRPDGIIDIDYDSCMGCGYCIVACPYYARSILFHNEYAIEMPLPSNKETALTQPDRIGVATKCNFCLQRIDAGISKGLKPGRDIEATPMCVVTCSSRALHFGDLDDPHGDLSILLRENRTICLQEELGTDPAVHYIVDEPFVLPGKKS